MIICQELVDSWINKVNVRFDTLNRETYRFITKTDYVEKVKAEIKKTSEVWLYPVKVNMVVTKGIKDYEIWDMFNFYRENRVILQLIEPLKSDACPSTEFFDDRA